MAGFFLKTRKRKTIQQKGSSIKSKKELKEIESDEDSIVSGAEDLESNESGSEDETAQEKRLRIAKEYINELELKEQEKQLDKDIDRDAISHRLQQDVLEDAGILQKFIANKITPDETAMKMLRGHQLSITCVVISSDSKFVFSASKDGSIFKWNTSTGNKEGKICGQRKQKGSGKEITIGDLHTGQILGLALSTDNKFLASAGHDKVIRVWNPDTLKLYHIFKGHRNIISGLAFQLKTHQLFSASHDKTIKVWNLDEMAYVETLFGHEDAVLGVDSLHRDRAVSCGGRDRSVRQWKIPEESQLVFQSSRGSSFDCVSMLNEEYFLTGDDAGCLSIFFIRKKKPIALRTNAHKQTDDVENSSDCNESWITAVTSLPYTDLIASGSCDGCIKLWRCEKAFKSIMPVHSIKMTGFVNSLKFSPNGEYLIVGVGQEHRLGRWWRMKEAKNCVYIIPLIQKTETDET